MPKRGKGAPAPGRTGTQFPTEADGSVSTTKVGKAVWTAAALAAGAEAAASMVSGEKDWRHGYASAVVLLAEEMAKSRHKALAGARAGLLAMESAFELRPPDTAAGTHGDPTTALPVKLFATVRDRAAGGPSARLGAVAVRCPGAPCAPEAAMPGVDVAALVDAWATYGACEPSTASNVRAALSAMSGPRGAEILRRHIFVCLGGTSEMCPVRTLLALGATVVAVARPGAKLQALLQWARGEARPPLPTRSAGAGGADATVAPPAGTLIVPVPLAHAAAGDTSSAGWDMLGDPAELAAWLVHLDRPEGGAAALGVSAQPAECAAAGVDEGEAGPVLVLGNYGYLDGADNVRLTVAVDAVISAAVYARPRKRTAVAYLASPATACTIPPEAAEAAAAAYGTAPAWTLKALRTPNARAPVAAAEGGLPRFVADGLVVLQGPNYALAKTSQQWRAACLAADGNCAFVSSNMAPGARTQSMVHKPTVLWALAGLEAFAPMVVPPVGIASHVMALLLLFDAQAPQVDFAQEGFTRSAFHGGSWRCPFTAQSLGWTAYALGRAGYEARPIAPDAVRPVHPNYEQ